MKICIDCGRELFDFDKVCDKCNGSNIIDKQECDQIISELKNANLFHKNQLLKNDKYIKIYNIMQHPKEEYPAPSILSNNKENSIATEEYWDRINQHTINNDKCDNHPIVHCPYCNSTDTKKITNTSKAVHTALFGIFSISRNSKQWHCNKCGSDF